MGQLPQQDRMPLHSILPLEPFQKWGLDFIGPIKPAATRSKSWYIFTTTDYYTKWVEAWALKDNMAHSVAQCLFKDVFTRFSSHFINKVIKKMTGFNMVLHHTSSPYYPQANGQAESSNM